MFDRQGEGISLLVPFRTDHAERERNWRWLKKYWEHELPLAELIEGTNEDTPFCKTSAVNRAFEKSHGDVIVILDADCYISGEVILEAARRIREARLRNRPLWFIPYRRFYRLTELSSLILLDTPPDNPLRFRDPPPPGSVETPASKSYGHWYGALIQAMPREAFILVGGMDERFRGWGGEDISMMYKVDTLYGRHKTLNVPTFHIHHPTIPGHWKQSRQWEGQAKPEMNDWLSWHYQQANGDSVKMRQLEQR